jgi:urease accessory protein UreE
MQDTQFRLAFAYPEGDAAALANAEFTAHFLGNRHLPLTRHA